MILGSVMLFLFVSLISVSSVVKIIIDLICRLRVKMGWCGGVVM